MILSEGFDSVNFAAFASQSANALGVDTAIAGVAITQGVAGRSGRG
jgi:hypothetical protein